MRLSRCCRENACALESPEELHRRHTPREFIIAFSLALSWRFSFEYGERRPIGGQEVKEKGDYVRKSLAGLPGVTEVTGMGLMIGVGLAKNLAEAVEACRKKGVLVLTAHDRMRLLPPLNIPFPVLREGIERIKEVIGE